MCFFHRGTKNSSFVISLNGAKVSPIEMRSNSEACLESLAGMQLRAKVQFLLLIMLFARSGEGEFRRTSFSARTRKGRAKKKEEVGIKEKKITALLLALSAILNIKTISFSFRLGCASHSPAWQRWKQNHLNNLLQQPINRISEF